MNQINQINRSVLSKLLMLFLTISITYSFFSMPVMAALEGDQPIGVIFAYGGNHGDIVLQGGWHKSASNNRFAVWYTKEDRKVMYCLEPGNRRSDESTATRCNNNYIRNNLSNRFLNGVQIEKFISYILAYGYVGSIDGGDDAAGLGLLVDPIVVSGGSSTTQAYEACQILIWETVVGERDANFNYVAPDSGFTPCKAIHTTDGNTGDAFETVYQAIAERVRNYGSIPSYCAPTLADAKNMPAIEANNGEFVFENVGHCDVWDWNYSVVDANGNRVSGARAVFDNGRVRVTLPSNVPEAYLYCKNRICADGVVAWSSDGTWGPGSTSQDLVQIGVADPVVGYAKMRNIQARIEVVKTSDYGEIENVRFNLYYRGSNTLSEPSDRRLNEFNIVTNAEGYGVLGGLPVGWYEIGETQVEYTRVEFSGDRFDPVTHNPVVFLSPETSTSVRISAVNHVNTIIRVNKFDELTGEMIGNTSFALYRDLNANGILDSEEMDTLVEQVDDDGDGVIEFTDIGVGSYLVKETASVGNYELSDRVVSVIVDKPLVYEVDYTNNAYGTAQIIKVNGDNHEEMLSDAVFAVYKDSDSDGLFDENIDEYLFDAVSDEDGTCVISSLERGNYLIFEKEAPSGFEIDPTVHPFEITLDNLDVVISNCDDLYFENYTCLVETSLKDEEGNSSSISSGMVTLTDLVSYKNVISGMEYSLELVLMDGETSEPLLDLNGNMLTTTITFTPSESEGEVEVPITVDASTMMGKTIVAFEKMYRDGNLVGSHEDIESVSQTYIFMPPTPTVTPTPVPTATPTPPPKTSTPSTGESSDGAFVTVISGIVISALSVSILVYYFFFYKKEG